jgi:hypothetical protein
MRKLSATPRTFAKFIFLEGEQISSGQRDVLRRLERMKFTTILNEIPTIPENIPSFIADFKNNLSLHQSKECFENLIFLNGSLLSLLFYPSLYPQKQSLLKINSEILKDLEYECVYFPSDETTTQLRIAHHGEQVDEPKITLQDIPHMESVATELQPLFRGKVWNSDSHRAVYLLMQRYKIEFKIPKFNLH